MSNHAIAIGAALRWKLPDAHARPRVRRNVI
jgi:hypothetical protein